MGLFDYFPYTNFHELNLQWIVETCKAAEKASNEASVTAEQILQYFQNLDVSDEVSEAVQRLYNDGVLTDIINAYIGGTVQNYGELSAEIAILKNRVAALLEDSPSDGEVVDIRTGYNGKRYDDAGDAVRGQVTDLWGGLATYAEQVNKAAPDYGAMSNGHMWPIILDNAHNVDWFNKEDGVYSLYKTLKGSAKIKAPKKLCIRFTSGAKIVINFYRDNGGVLEWTNEVFEYVTGNKRVNYVGFGDTPGGVFDIPDGHYFNIAVYEGSVEVYGWDGVKFGVPVGGMLDVLKTDGALSSMPTSGGGVFTAPGNAVAVVCNSGAVRSIGVIKNGVQTRIEGVTSRFATFPGDGDWYLVTYFPGYNFADDSYISEAVNGEIDDVSIICPNNTAAPAGRARMVAANCREVLANRWTPVQNVKGSGTARTFKAGVTYRGIPYASTWERIGLVGWHVSRRTFLSAVADPLSIFYKERVNREDNAPPYGINCSAFATMCGGWAMPQTNAGMVGGYGVRPVSTVSPIPGAVYSSGGHCLTPGMVSECDGVDIVQCFEAVTPVLQATTRYGNIAEYAPLAFEHNRGKTYMGAYGVSYAPDTIPISSTCEMGEFTAYRKNDGELTLGSARPYRGDYSVSTDRDTQTPTVDTSLDIGVLINIHRSDATTLNVYNDADALIGAIPISGRQTVDIKGYLNVTGLYSVSTDVDDRREYFEYVRYADRDRFPVLYSLKDGVLYPGKEDGASAVCYMCTYGAAIFED